MAGPLRGGGGKWSAIKKNILFKFVALVKKKDNLLKMTYRNIHIQVYILNFVVC